MVLWLPIDIEDGERQLTDLKWDHLAALPGADLLLIAARVLTYGMSAESKRAAFNKWVGASVAFDRLQGYRRRMLALNEERFAINRLIDEMRDRREHPLDTDNPWSLSLDLHVTLHLISICVSNLETLVDLIRQATAVRLQSDGRKLLGRYKDLRDTFEHIEQRLPGKRFEQEMVKKYRDDEELIHLGWGLSVNRDNSISTKTGPIRLNSEELKLIDSVIERYETQVITKVISDLWQRWQSDPEAWAGVNLSDPGLVRRLLGP